MPPEYVSDGREWLERADRDLGLARLALRPDTPYYDGVAYHAQQAAEKALKGFLAAHGETLPRTHHLLTLIDVCQRLNPDFMRFTNAAATLTPYATEFRYPGGRLEPTADEAQTAFQYAAGVVEFVRGLLEDAD